MSFVVNFHSSVIPFTPSTPYTALAFQHTALSVSAAGLRRFHATPVDSCLSRLNHKCNSQQKDALQHRRAHGEPHEKLRRRSRRNSCSYPSPQPPSRSPAHFESLRLAKD